MPLLPLSALPAEPDWLPPHYPHAHRLPARDKAAEPSVPLDLPSSIERAIDYLRNFAPEAVEGAAGDKTTFAVACRLMDLALSNETAFALLGEHWNEAGKAIPPWSADDLWQKVLNASNHAQNVRGSALGLTQFDDTTSPVEGEVAKPRFGQWVEPFDSTKIPKRAWVLGHLLAQGFVTGLVAPSGAGKTTLEIQIALAIITGRSDILGMAVKKRCRVFLWNQEDELDELKRRLAAAMLAFGISFDDLQIDGRPALVLGSGVDNALMVARRGPNSQGCPKYSTPHMPRRAPTTSANFASSAATMRSQAQTSMRPAAKVVPCTWAMVILRRLRQRRVFWKK